MRASVVIKDFIVKSKRCVYLDSPNHPVGELQSSHSSRSSKGGGAALKPADYPTIFPVLLNREPDQVPESLDWTKQKTHHMRDTLKSVHSPTLNDFITAIMN